MAFDVFVLPVPLHIWQGSKTSILKFENCSDEKELIDLNAKIQRLSLFFIFIFSISKTFLIAFRCFLSLMFIKSMTTKPPIFLDEVALLFLSEASRFTASASNSGSSDMRKNRN